MEEYLRNARGLSTNENAALIASTNENAPFHAFTHLHAEEEHGDDGRDVVEATRQTSRRRDAGSQHHRAPRVLGRAPPVHRAEAAQRGYDAAVRDGAQQLRGPGEGLEPPTYTCE